MMLCCSVLLSTANVVRTCGKNVYKQDRLINQASSLLSLSILHFLDGFYLLFVILPDSSFSLCIILYGIWNTYRIQNEQGTRFIIAGKSKVCIYNLRYKIYMLTIYLQKHQKWSIEKTTHSTLKTQLRSPCLHYFTKNNLQNFQSSELLMS